MPIIKCPGCGKETNTVFIDFFNGGKKGFCYLTISKEGKKYFWRRGCVPKDRTIQNPYYVWSAKQDLDKEIKTHKFEFPKGKK
jgi:hypothetical protein